MLAAGGVPAEACACGIALDSAVTRESALVIERPGHERVLLSLDLSGEGPGSRAAVVVPVPGVSRVRAIEHGDPIAYLERATAPPIGAAVGGADGTAAAAPADVIGREEVGGYHVWRLRAGGPPALDAWLDANGYALPDGARPILADYLHEGWDLIAIRLAPGEEGRLRPLEISFATDRPVYPMRLAQLASEPLTLTVYTLANGKRRIKGLATVWSGAISELDPPPPQRLAELFASADYLTRLQLAAAQPSGFTSDLEIERARGGIEEPAAELFSRVVDEGHDVSPIALVAVALLGLGLGAFLWRVIGAGGPDRAT